MSTIQTYGSTSTKQYEAQPGESYDQNKSINQSCIGQSNRIRLLHENVIKPLKEASMASLFLSLPFKIHMSNDLDRRYQ